MPMEIFHPTVVQVLKVIEIQRIEESEAAIACIKNKRSPLAVYAFMQLSKQQSACNIVKECQDWKNEEGIPNQTEDIKYRNGSKNKQLFSSACSSILAGREGRHFSSTAICPRFSKPCIRQNYQWAREDEY